MGIGTEHIKKINNMNLPNLSHRGIKLEPWPTVYGDHYLPHQDERYWCPEIETADEATMNNIIVFKLRHIVEWAWGKSSFYRKKWKDAGVHPDTIRSVDDLVKFPVVTKQELRQAQTDDPPFGNYLCTRKDEAYRIHGTSGTTGTPTLFGINNGDWSRIANAHARIMWGAGIRPSDTIFIGSFFSLYLGSWGVLAGGERLGASVVPFGAGIQGHTKVAVHLMKRMKPTCFYGTPSYALHLAEVAREEGIDPRKDFSFHTLLFSGEPGASIPSTKKKIAEIFNAKCIDMGSMAEMTPWMTNAECTFRTGMHLWQDIVYTQICDPKTFKPVPFGEEGTPIYTHLERTSQPMIRFVSGDLSRWDNTPCECGRTYPRLPLGVYGRIDDMLIIRGHNVYPSVIEDTLRSIRGVGDEFRIIVSKEGAMNELCIEAEYQKSHGSPVALSKLQGIIIEKLYQTVGVRSKVKMAKAGTLARTQFKARRIIDDRDLYRNFIE